MKFTRSLIIHLSTCFQKTQPFLQQGRSWLILVIFAMSLVFPWNGSYAANAEIVEKIPPDLTSKKEINLSTLPSGVSQDWWGTVQQDIQNSEYDISWQSNPVYSTISPSYQGPNRAHNLRTYFTEQQGIQIIPRANPSGSSTAPDWQLGFQISGYGDHDPVDQIGTSEIISATHNKLKYGHGSDIDELFINSKDGLEQIIVLNRAPHAGKGQLGSAIVELSFTGSLDANLIEDDSAVEFATVDGVAVFYYSNINITDAAGKALAWSLQLIHCGQPEKICTLKIHIHTVDAVYPITIDPLITAAPWTIESNSPTAKLGWSVSSAGDVNDDGYDDVIVGAPYFDVTSGDEGKVFIYHGSSSGLNTSASRILSGSQTGASFGYSVGTAGDVDDNGYDEVIIGAPYYDNGQTDEGRAYVYYGSSDGIGTNPNKTLEINQNYAIFGYSVGTAGDVDDNRYDEVIIGAPGYDYGSYSDVGQAYVYYGSSNGLNSSPSWTSPVIKQTGTFFGNSVGTAGDVDGNGYDEVIIGAPGYDNGQTDEGGAYVYYGSSDGLTTNKWMAEGNQVSANFGSAVGTAGDVNGDGFDDVIIGVPYYDNGQTNEGRAYVYYGSISGMTNVPWAAESDQASANFGYSVGTAGDVNGDGLADVIVGAKYYDSQSGTITDDGKAYVYYGISTGLSSSPNWSVTGKQGYAYLGGAVATAGDINGDGFDDVIIGASNYDNGQTDEGRAYVYLGSANGLDSGPHWMGEGNQANAYFGFSVGTAGDVNGDSYSDIIVGAYLYDNGQTDEGKVFVYHGSSSGLSLTANWTAESDLPSAYFGYSVDTAGDIKNNGYSDVIIGAPGVDSPGMVDRGRVYVYFGSASGLGSGSWYIDGDMDNDSFGSSVGTAGDVNGDGYADIIIGSPGDVLGRAFVFFGTSTGLNPLPWIADDAPVDSNYGTDVGTAGDVNGDGYSDVIVGANYYSGCRECSGAVFIYYGSRFGLLEPASIIGGHVSDSNFGFAVSTAGDINGDGYSDIVVGAPNYDNGQVSEGAAYIYYGSSSGIAASTGLIFESNQTGANYGSSVGSAGDFNGDGYADVIIGAYNYDNVETDEGRAYLYHGSSSGLNSTAAWVIESNQTGANFGVSVGTAGDVNGDGFSDVIVGSHRFDNGETDEGAAFVFCGAATPPDGNPNWYQSGAQSGAGFGYSISTAGDINGDGFSDVIIGSHLFDNGYDNAGRVYVFYGSSAGLGSTPWTAEGDRQDAYFGQAVGAAGDVNGDGYIDVIIGAYGYSNTYTRQGKAYVYYGSSSGLNSSPGWTKEGDQANAYLGYSVGTAGDVNGDGLADIVIGAPNEANGQAKEGKVYVFHGASGGLNSTADWSAEGNQANAYFGISAGTAGDVNRDGYSDVIIGTPAYDDGYENEGKVFVYYGSESGLNSVSWAYAGGQENAAFGTVVGTAGDVNGDGYSDILVGAPAYDHGQIDEGVLFIYLGGPFGLLTTPGLFAEGNQAWAHFGLSAASLGDVNGDGYSDVIVGAPGFDGDFTDEGQAYVYYGASSGLQPIARWTAKGSQENTNLGYAVGAAGDVNGDGFGDILIGAYLHDGTQIDEGTAQVYYGNAQPGIAFKTHQDRYDSSARIAPLGRTTVENNFYIKVQGLSPYGRTKVKLEWEVKPLSQPFNGSGLSRSASWTDTGTTGASLSTLIGSLSAGTGYHWRVRICYNLAITPYQPCGRWMSIPWNGWNELDLRTRP